MMNKPKVSIVITCYKYGEFLENCIISAINSGYGDQEIIVVDDCSPDELTQQMLNYCEGKYDTVRFIRLKNNGGVSKTRNTGIAESKGCYFLCLDADDELVRGALDKMVESVEHEEGSFAYGDFKTFGAKEEIMKSMEFSIKKMKRQELVITCSTLCPKAAWEKIGGFDEDRNNLYEDWDFWISICGIGYKGKHVDSIVLRYRIHAGSRNSLALKSYLKQIIRLSRKHKDYDILIGGVKGYVLMFVCKILRSLGIYDLVRRHWLALKTKRESIT